MSKNVELTTPKGHVITASVSLIDPENSEYEVTCGSNIRSILENEYTGSELQEHIVGVNIDLDSTINLTIKGAVSAENAAHNAIRDTLNMGVRIKETPGNNFW